MLAPKLRVHRRVSKRHLRVQPRARPLERRLASGSKWLARDAGVIESHKMKKLSKSQKPRSERRGFESFAREAARAAGRPLSFGVAISVIIIWAVCGPFFILAIRGNW